MERDSTGLWRGRPPPPVPIVSSNEPVSRLQSAEAVREYLARTGEAPLGLDWAGDHRPPEPRPVATVLFTAAAGAAALPTADDGMMTGELANPTLLLHDGKALVERWLGWSEPPPRIEGTAVGA